jgi:GNAT superfamily N-acetyltransferase
VTSPLALERFSFDDPVVVALVDDLQQEFVVRYGGPDETVIAPGDFEPPRGAFFVGFDAGLPVAMGGWRFRPDVQRLDGSVSAEVKRMYVVPPAQRRGFARAVLAHLELTADDAGADTMVLETGLEQPEAIALYESSGYALVENFGYYQDSPLARCFAKRL